ncbi:hypothetical protein L3Q82_024426 [Scortum barcoo]|uniref:Uncharacterized protein n=1 Tax=Scortum barcoo TaxID=214431 RepID=A0ACB8WQ85_9TELE|nr:hypothetical protein L3Q82_024426 [Scortum barcoo]
MVFARGSLTAAIRYRDEILRPLVRPYAGAVGPGFLLMQDNARPHVAGVCQQFLQEEGIDDAMDWPARSPDLNPIEHIWDIMSRSIHQRHVAPQTVQELADALVQVWEEIPQETIRHLIRSMPRRTAGISPPGPPPDAAKLLKDNPSVQVRSAPVREELLRQNALTVVRQRGGEALDKTELCGEDILQFGKYKGKSSCWLLENDNGYNIYLIQTQLKEEAAGVFMAEQHSKDGLFHS